MLASLNQSPRGDRVTNRRLKGAQPSGRISTVIAARTFNARARRSRDTVMPQRARGPGDNVARRIARWRGRRIVGEYPQFFPVRRVGEVMGSTTVTTSQRPIGDRPRRDDPARAAERGSEQPAITIEMALGWAWSHRGSLS